MYTQASPKQVPIAHYKNALIKVAGIQDMTNNTFCNHNMFMSYFQQSQSIEVAFL